VNLLYFTTAYEHDLIGNPIHEEFLDSFVQAGHQARVFVPTADRNARDTFRVEPANPPIVRTAVSRNALERFQNKISGQIFHYHYFLNLLRRYRQYLKEHPEIDIIHAESVYPIGAVAALSGDPRPFIPTIRGGDLIADSTIGYGFARFPLVRKLIKLTFERAALVRAVSPGGVDMAVAAGCPAEKIVTIPRNLRNDYFVDDVPAFRATRRAMIAERHGVQGQRIIVAAGRLLPVKGFDDLIRALPAVLEKVPNTSVLVCGQNRIDERLGDYAAYLRRLAEEHGVAQRFILVGEVPFQQMADYYAAADVVAIPSLMEGGNKTLSEGTLFGTPFVATETAGTIGFFDSSHGLSIPVRNPSRLAQALIDVLGDEATWQQRHQACLTMRERFRSSRVTAEMVQLYQQAMKTKA
jgi:teichuronic acid biosynthesis glycosyltransferase TuaC